ncbi:MAG TPA: anti-sigma factor, partial [Gemmatimonadales bacterium]|nr:anti-sigma factor [Gemmatimonadales bacterium]
SKPEPAVQLFVNPHRRLAIAQAARLPELAPGRAYQLWFIPRSGKPIASVSFKVETFGNALVTNIPVPLGIVLTAAAITEEPDGGSSEPTSPFLLSGTL